MRSIYAIAVDARSISAVAVDARSVYEARLGTWGAVQKTVHILSDIRLQAWGAAATDVMAAAAVR